MSVDHTPVPSLSSDGWITHTPIKADRLLAYFFLSEYSRSYLNHGGVASLTWLLQRYSKDASRLQEETKETLKTYFGKHFPKVDVQVEIKNMDQGKASMIFSILVTDHEGKEYTVSDTVDTLNGAMVRIQSLNNYGVLP